MDYLRGRLDESDLLPTPAAPTPWATASAWLDDAVRAGAGALRDALPEPLAMVLSTVDAAARPRSRTVLLRGADPRGFVLFTNHDSAKGRDLAGNGWVSLCFGWYPLQRQLLVRGYAGRVGDDETRSYFTSRPWASRIGAWASRQSRPVARREDVDARWAELAERWPDTGSPDDVPVPDFWGGYRVHPVEVEFWQGRASRLHDRLAFVAGGEPPAPPPGTPSAAVSGFARLDDAAAWRLERRQP